MTTIQPEAPEIQPEGTGAGVGSPTGSMATGQTVTRVSPKETLTTEKTEGVGKAVVGERSEEAKPKGAEATGQPETTTKPRKFIDQSRSEATARLRTLTQAVTHLNEGVGIFRRSAKLVVEKGQYKAVPRSFFHTEKTVGTSRGSVTACENLITDLTEINLDALDFDQTFELQKQMRELENNSWFSEFLKHSEENNQSFQHFKETLYNKIKAISVPFHLQQLSVTVFPEMRDAYNDLVKRGASLTSPGRQKTADEMSAGAKAFEEEVTAFEKRIIDSFVTELGCSRSDAERIFKGAQTNWEGLYVEKNDIITQNHDIPRLKIYRDPGTKQLIADYGIKEIGRGTFKRAKAIRQIGGEARVRLTSSKKARELELNRLIENEMALGKRKDSVKLDALLDESHTLSMEFLMDIHKEEAARGNLKNVPNIAGMTTILYWSKDKPGKPSQLKTRYIMTKYEGDLWSLAIKSTEQADHEKALRCCIGVCDCLQQMHEKGFVHGDLKLLNVLFKGNTGFVSDFGFCSEVEKPILHTGTVLYQAPEKVFNLSRKLDKSMDMFSFGIMLLGIVDRNRYLQWRKDIEELKRITTSRGSVPENREAMYKKYCDLHSKLMADLAKSSDPICTDLIFPLLNFDPTKRPTIGEAKATFTRLLRERQEAHPLPPAQP